MNTQQKLADIHMLVTYIKEHVDKRPSESGNAKLDEIGTTTLEIAEMLKKVEQETGPGADIMFADYKEHIGSAADKVLEQLTDVKRTLDMNTGLTKDLYTKIEEIYTDYTGILEKATKTLEMQRENFSNEIRTLSDQVESLKGVATSLDKKTLTKDQISEIMGQIESKLEEIAGKDAEINDAYIKSAKHLEEMIGGIRNAYEDLNETLASVDESFKTAVSRMDVVLMQMNILTGEGK